MRVLRIHDVEARHIDPGSPWQNGIDERFNGTLRSECLNLETFHSRGHARALVKLYGRFYNHQRPHSSLGRAITPEEFYQQWKKQQDGCAGGQGAGLCPDVEASPPLPRDLSHCGPPAMAEEEDGSSVIARPASRLAIHVGAPVASQQSRILRVDETSIAAKAAGAFPAAETSSMTRRT